MKFFQLSALLLAGLLSACGGGSDSAAPNQSNTSSQNNLQQEPGAPVFSGTTAQDGLNWINYRRTQIGLSPMLLSNSLINAAAQGHSNYQKANNTVTHVQTAGQPGFTGATLTDRLSAAGYVLTPPYAAGEVIAAATDASGFVLSEQLITAIYHRFVIFEPIFKDIGAGSASVAGGYTYFTSDFAASNGYAPGLARGNVVIYPFANQLKVATNFFTDQETPDPVANQNETGYPVSVHANLGSVLSVTTFTLRPHGGAVLSVKLLSGDTDAETPRSAAAIIPLAVLAANTTYDVAFSGSVDSVSVTRAWSFTTQ